MKLDMRTEAVIARQAQKNRLWKAPAAMIRVRGRGGRASVSTVGKATNAEGRMTVSPSPTELSETASLDAVTFGQRVE